MTQPVLRARLYVAHAQHSYLAGSYEATNTLFVQSLKWNVLGLQSSAQMVCLQPLYKCTTQRCNLSHSSSDDAALLPLHEQGL